MLPKLQPAPPDDPRVIPGLPVGPTPAEWAALGEAGQSAFYDALQAAIEADHDFMSEGVPHGRSIRRSLDVLTGFYRRTRRDLYLASDLPVLYPRGSGFCPDLLAVADQPASDDADRRRCWNVAVEGRGIDLALEVLFHGSRTKDLQRNVRHFAALGIPEYFVYDGVRNRIHGFRLPPGAVSYLHLYPVDGVIHSEVLGVDLDVSFGRLRFCIGGAELPETSALMQVFAHKLEATDAERAEMERLAEAERHRAEAERDRAEAERLRADTERSRAEEALQRVDTERSRAEEALQRVADALQRAEAERTRAEAAEAALAALKAELAARPTRP